MEKNWDYEWFYEWGSIEVYFEGWGGFKEMGLEKKRIRGSKYEESCIIGKIWVVFRKYVRSSLVFLEIC